MFVQQGHGRAGRAAHRNNKSIAGSGIDTSRSRRAGVVLRNCCTPIRGSLHCIKHGP